MFEPVRAACVFSFLSDAVGLACAPRADQGGLTVPGGHKSQRQLSRRADVPVQRADEVVTACMARLIGRQREIGDLNEIARPGAQFILVYGRRQVGKTTLIMRWAEQTKRPVIYWSATRDTPAQVRLSFMRALWGWAHPGTQAVPRFETWGEVFDTAARL